MKFILADKIESIELGKRIVTVKALSLAEEYLADHFPIFPVLPGVMMIEAMVQSAAWLVRLQQNFAKSIIVLRSARNVRYSSFVAPGNFLRCELEAVSIRRFGKYLHIEFRGRSFLRRMVRIMTGLLLQIGAGRVDPGSVKKILSGKEKYSPLTMPPHGLYLKQIKY